MTPKTVLTAVLAAATVAATFAAQRAPAPANPNVEWRAYGGDLRHQHYSPLAQIDVSNFNGLEVAWRFKTDSLGPRPEFKLEGTPLEVNGILYTTAGTRRAVVALDASTGELRWVHAEYEGARAAASPRQLSGRGVAYWTDGREERILYVTTGYRLVALDATTGAKIPGFGKNGIVDLKEGAVFGKEQPIDLVNGEIGVHSTPSVTKDGVVMIGSSFLEGGTPKTHNNSKGLVRGYDVRTGSRLWTFNTIPRPGEFGNDTWEKESWAVTGNTGVWNQISVDEELGMAYLPVETPSSDFYGGLRPGNNLFAESIVAIDYKTGQRKWHFQLVTIRSGTWTSRRRRCRRYHGERSAGEGGRRDGQAGDAVSLQSRDRSADLSDRRAARPAVRRAGREDVTDAAVSDQAAAVRSPGRHGR
jgi:quinoprotein glucose dehydrogenase